MFAEKPRHTGHAGAPWKLVVWRVALAQRDGLVVAGERGQQIAEAPDPALINGGLRETALQACRFQFGRIGHGFFPLRVGNFQQVFALLAAEILAGFVAPLTASAATA